MALYGYFLLLYQVLVRRIDNVGKTVWTFIEGDSHGISGNTSYSVGFCIAQVVYRFTVQYSVILL